MVTADAMIVWHRLSTMLWDFVTTYWEEVELFKLCHNILSYCLSSKRSTNHCCLCSIGQVVPPLEHPKVVRKLPQGCHDISFLFSKCLSCLTYSHNASAVSLIFFCNSEYDQSLVLRSRFPVWSAPRTSRYLRMTKSDPCRRDWNMIILFICLLRQCRKCSTVGKSLIFF